MTLRTTLAAFTLSAILAIPIARALDSHDIQLEAEIEALANNDNTHIADITANGTRFRELASRILTCRRNVPRARIVVNRAYESHLVDHSTRHGADLRVTQAELVCQRWEASLTRVRCDCNCQ